MIIHAPYPGHQVTTILPNPVWANVKANVGKMAMKRAVDGTLFTYVQRTPRRKMAFSFELSQMKIQELFYLIKHYSTKEWLIEFEGVWQVKLTNNPIQASAKERAELSFEVADVTLEFEGVKL